MKCITCKTEMECEGISKQSTIHWESCPKCNSVAEIHSSDDREYIIKVIWERDRN